MEPTTLCILTFPQRYENGRIVFNIVVIPRNLNPLLPIVSGQPAFADAQLHFNAMVINSLDGLPLSTNVTFERAVEIENNIESSRAIWEGLKIQLEQMDGMKIDDAETSKPDQKAQSDVNRYKEVAIRKYLPESYRNSFNFIKAKTKYALTGDEYQCAVKNKEKDITDKRTDRDTLSWGKVIAYCLRNPQLAQKTGLIYKASVAIPDGGKWFEDGGWLYADLDTASDYHDISKLKYAARIPALKGKSTRGLFAAVQFPVSEIAVEHPGYDQVMREAILYDDGFAKIVHANQPVNQDLLQEKDVSNPPLKDAGIRLGWDDEQIAIWFNRQMLQKEETTDTEIDAPLGVFGYRLDVREKGQENWLSQNKIIAERGTSILNGEIEITAIGDKLEPGTEVHPAAHGNSVNDGFWLPMYFSAWAGKAITIADKDSEDINMLTPDKMVAPNPGVNNTINTIPKKTFHPYIQDPDHHLSLIYGHDYQFRVRLMDISGGGPIADEKAINGGECPVADAHFKRYVAAGSLNILNIKHIYDSLDAGTNETPLKDTSILENLINEANPVLTIQRPLLAYPAVVYTGKYTDPIDQLKAVLGDLPDGGTKKGLDIGLPDPDVDAFKVSIEVKSLEMDNALSENGRESYILWYEKEYELDSQINKYDQLFDLNIVYKDFDKLDFKNGIPLDERGSKKELVLPTSRHLRITFTPIINAADNNYAAENIMEGKKVRLSSFKPAKNERLLLSPIDGGLVAIYLQPEQSADQLRQKNNNGSDSLNIINSSTPVELSRLADALDLVAHNLTLEGNKGKRIQFGCSKAMRHSMAPDSSSVSFSSLAELYNQWVIAVNYSLLRDWAWDGLEVESISIYRQWKKESAAGYQEEELAGTINISRTAGINALQEPDRKDSQLIFLDAFDPKKVNGEFPSEIMISYRIVVNFKDGFEATAKDHDIENEVIHLPVTIIPHQVPKLVSAGIALSPYIADEERYASTNIRQRFLWLEMAEPPADPNDTYYVRVLANAPDPLLCRITGDILTNDPADPPLNVNEEKIRIIIKGMDNDFAGIGVMQEMIPEDDSNGKSRYFMVPLPPGLHADSDELFGFFSYEIRVGHKKELWSTAQARYGRPLKVNGVQHPAPALNCNAFRRKNNLFTGIGHGLVLEREGLHEINTAIKKKTQSEVIVTAPFAVAVLNGKNVSARPPQTSLWYMLYTQVKQADGSTYRNILLDSGPMPYVPPKYKREIKSNLLRTPEGIIFGSATIKLKDIESRLTELGLPTSSSLSVLCVEMFPMQNVWQTSIGHRGTKREVQEARILSTQQQLNPLTDGLGSYRIYRTSPLVPVANVCCDDC